MLATRLHLLFSWIAQRTGRVALVCTAAALIAYARTFDVPFIGDDGGAIAQNTTIRDLSDLGNVLNPPVAGGLTVGGRPVLNLTFALNYALSGPRVWSYHVANLSIHLAATLLLFGVVWRTLRTPRLAWSGPDARLTAFGASLLWLLHPLQTESVTYTVQRAESLLALFFLATLYALVRASRSANATAWLAVSVTACLLGMATKEVMVGAPLLMLLFDRTFLSGSFAAAWRARRPYFLALAATWLPLLFLVVTTQGRGGSAGFGTEVTAWHYALTQCQAIVLYLRLTVWPFPLIFDYGMGVATSLVSVLPHLAVLLLLLAGTAWAVVRRPCLGFLGALFFVILAPSSSVVPVATQTIAEHRMYLPLAALAVLAAIGIQISLTHRAAAALGAASLALLVVTVARNEVYRDALTLARHTVLHRPENARAHYTLGHALLVRGDAPAAVQAFQRAVQLLPDYVEAYHDLGSALVQAGQPAAALPHYERAIRYHPIAPTHYAYASALAQLGRNDEALRHYSRALELDPNFAEAHNNRANLLLHAGQREAAIAGYQAALELKPDYLEAHVNFSMALLGLGRKPEALAQMETAVRLHPNSAVTHWKLGDVQAESGKLPEARESYRTALRLDPTHVPSALGFGRALLQTGDLPAAAAFLENLVRQLPDSAEAHYLFAATLANARRSPDAIRHAETALKLQPGFPEADALLKALRP